MLAWDLPLTLMKIGVDLCQGFHELTQMPSTQIDNEARRQKNLCECLWASERICRRIFDEGAF